jgi:hypothetical protein
MLETSFSRLPDDVDNFDEFGVDTSCRTAPLHLASGITLSTIGTHSNDLDEIIDAPPFESTLFTVNGSTFVQAFTNIADPLRGYGEGDLPFSCHSTTRCRAGVPL